jgi:hypothetical protein
MGKSRNEGAYLAYNGRADDVVASVAVRRESKSMMAPEGSSEGTTSMLLQTEVSLSRPTTCENERPLRREFSRLAPPC